MEILIGKNAGFCYGVKRAVESSENLVKKNKKTTTYCLGELVHNKQVIEQLEHDGIKFIEDIDEVLEENSKVIIRAHGVPKEVYEKAKQKNVVIEDFTCPNVLKIHRIAAQHQKENFYTFLTGSQKHPEVQGIISHCRNRYTIIENQDDLENAFNEFKQSGCKKLLLVSQTTYSLEKFNNIEKIISEMVEDGIEYVVENTICFATEVRQKATNELSSKVDKMIIIGGKNSSNTKKLYEIALKNCSNTINIETYKDLNEFNFLNSDVIGIMAGASTPQSSINDVVDYLKKSEVLTQ